MVCRTLRMRGATGEVAYDLNGNVLPASEDGVDSEGFTLAPDGSFWVSDDMVRILFILTGTAEQLNGSIRLVQEPADVRYR